MRQINEDTGTTRPIQRKVLTVPSTFNNNHQTRTSSDIESVVASFRYGINYYIFNQYFIFLIILIVLWAGTVWQSFNCEENILYHSFHTTFICF